MREMTDGERAIWNEMQADACPEYVELSERRNVARKFHRCTLCQSHILPGETYHKIAFTEDGHFGTAKHCWRHYDQDYDWVKHNA